MSQKKIMILGASDLQVPIIKKAKELGHFVIGLDMNPNALGFQYTDEKIIASTMDYDKVLSSAKNKKIDAIITAASDQPMNIVARVSEELGLVSISVNSAKSTTNKFLMRSKLAKANIPIPKFFKISNFDEFKLALSKMNGESIVKPVDSSGSRGVFYCNKFSENLEYIYEESCKQSKSNLVILEEYMRGVEVSVESFSVEGTTHVITITDKKTTGKPNFVELAHSQPTVLNSSTIKMIEKITKDSISALGIKNGPSHTEIMVTDEGPKIIEVGARLGGDNITSHLVPLSTGVDMLKATIESSLGIVPNLEKTINSYSKIVFITTKAGLLKKISGLEEAKNIKNIEKINIFKSIGDDIKIPSNSSERFGYIIASSTDQNEVNDSIQKALNILTLEID